MELAGSLPTFPTPTDNVSSVPRGLFGYFFCNFFIHPSMISCYLDVNYFFREFFFYLLSILTGLNVE